MAYLLLVVVTVNWLGYRLGLLPAVSITPLMKALVVFNLFAFAWRVVWRFAFTAREYGWIEGIRAVLRFPVANAIAILAGRRALMEYIATLRGQKPRWDKTTHDVHPALIDAAQGYPR